MKSTPDVKTALKWNGECTGEDYTMNFEYWLNYLCFKTNTSSESGEQQPSAKTYSYVFATICILEQLAIVAILRKSLKKKKAIEESRKINSIRNYHKNYAILSLKLI
jgi:hypothetical protein